MSETYISFYLRANRIHVFADALRGIGSPSRICFLLDSDGKALLMVPYAKRDFKSHRVPSKTYSGKAGVEISSMGLCKLVANRHGWDISRSYRVPGRVSSAQALAAFDLEKAEMIIPTGGSAAEKDTVANDFYEIATTENKDSIATMTGNDDMPKFNTIG